VPATTFEIVLTGPGAAPPAQQTLAGQQPIQVFPTGPQQGSPFALPPTGLPAPVLPAGASTNFPSVQPVGPQNAIPLGVSALERVVPVEIVKSIPLRIAGAGDNSPGPDNEESGGGGGPGLLGSLGEAFGPHLHRGRANRRGVRGQARGQ
jgi:hypothetical protein